MEHFIKDSFKKTGTISNQIKNKKPTYQMMKINYLFLLNKTFL